MGKTPSRNNAEYWSSKDHKWISIADLSACGKYIKQTKELISDKAVIESGISQIPANTVVMSFKLSIGKTAITTEPMYSNEAIMSFRDKGIIELIPDYVYYLLLSKKWESNTNKAVMGKTLNKASLSMEKVNVHESSEQRIIVQILDKVNNLIDIQKQQIKCLDDLVSGRFVEMFINKNYPLVKVGDLIKQNTDVVKIINTKVEKYVTVGMHGTGARQRVIKDGKWPVAFSGYRVKSGQFIYSRIDARNGAFAILSDELDNAVVSKDFPVFDIDITRVLPQVFLSSVLEDRFVKQVQNSSFGATNRQRIKEDIFAKYTIPLAPIEVQMKYEIFVKAVDKSKFQEEIQLKTTELTAKKC